MWFVVRDDWLDSLLEGVGFMKVYSRLREDGRRLVTSTGHLFIRLFMNAGRWRTIVPG